LARNGMVSPCEDDFAGCPCAAISSALIGRSARQTVPIGLK
jgi:hypothetical protein